MSGEGRAEPEAGRRWGEAASPRAPLPLLSACRVRDLSQFLQERSSPPSSALRPAGCWAGCPAHGAPGQAELQASAGHWEQHWLVTGTWHTFVDLVNLFPLLRVFSRGLQTAACAPEPSTLRHRADSPEASYSEGGVCVQSTRALQCSEGAGLSGEGASCPTPPPHQP